MGWNPFARAILKGYRLAAMNWIWKLEKRFGHLAVPHLIRVVVFFNAFVWILWQLNPQFISWLTLDPRLVAQGQAWRLVSYIFIPPLTNFVWIAFALMFLWMFGEGLEQAWGSFRLNLFYLIGMIGTTVAALLTPGDGTNAYLNLSLLFAFATLYPNHQILLFLIIPLQIKWLAWLSLIFLVMAFAGGTLAGKAAIAASFLNYVLFFGRDLWQLARHRKEVGQRRRKFAEAARSSDDALHQCHICRRTELTDPDLDFRVAADGEEYCVDHLPSRAET